MRFHNQRRYLRVAIFLAILFVSGCASIDGPKFMPVSNTPSDKSVVYLYKPLAYGKDVFTISIEGKPVTKLKKGGYYPYITAPGKLEITSKINPRLILPLFASVGYLLEPDNILNLNVEPGKTYYVKMTGVFDLELVDVPAEVAVPELKKCRLLPPYAP